MKALSRAQDLVKAKDLKGPSDLYEALLTVKHGFDNGSTLGHYAITKAQAKAAGINWKFIEESCEMLGLRIDSKHGRYGHMIYL